MKFAIAIGRTEWLRHYSSSPLTAVALSCLAQDGID
jgi:hypothetical protein